MLCHTMGMRWRLFAAVLLLVVGCAPKRGLAGHTWTGAMMDFPATLVFEGNGANSIKIESVLGVVSLKGTYSETNDSVTFSFQEVDVPSTARQGAKMLDRIKGAPIGFKLEWKSDTEVTMTPQGAGGIFGSTIELRRKAE